jgi:hypothetical protein
VPPVYDSPGASGSTTTCRAPASRRSYVDTGNQGPFGAMLLPFDYGIPYETGEPRDAVRKAVQDPLIRLTYGRVCPSRACGRHRRPPRRRSGPRRASAAAAEQHAQLETELRPAGAAHVARGLTEGDRHALVEIGRQVVRPSQTEP